MYEAVLASWGKEPHPAWRKVFFIAEDAEATGVSKRDQRKGRHRKTFFERCREFFCFETEKIRSAEIPKKMCSEHIFFDSTAGSNIFKNGNAIQKSIGKTDVSDVTSTGKTQNSHIREDVKWWESTKWWEPPRTSNDWKGWLFRLGCGRIVPRRSVEKSNRSSLKSKKTRST